MESVNVKAGETAKTSSSRSAFESQTFNLDMSIRVDQPVGSMSISPSGRDVVLASRQGLHIIDLDAPYSPPRHLPHRTPWEVADVQWSPFAARDYWVVSTSNQKALVWNLNARASVDAIEHVLHAHSRAITDINFSAHHPDILATCSVDSSVHGWDLRDPARPVMTFCDWFAGATQVKWNRQNSHIIASSHDKYLIIWDDRKGASPLRSIRAHDTKIYGIDWNRTRLSGIVTCSLDSSIKFWDYSVTEDIPERVIRTPFPVWRARHTPFGWGLLAMPQRGDTDLHLYDRRLGEGVPKDGVIPPVHKFEGHEDQVKEFLWRWRGDVAGGIDNREFQLVSWGADRDLRLHRVNEKILEQIGYQRGKEIRKNLNITRKDAIYKTFRDEQVATLPPYSENANGGARVSSGSVFGGTLKGAIRAGMNKAPIPLSKGWGSGGYASSTGMQAKQKVRRGVNAIDWMKGIKIGKKETSHGCSTRSDDREKAMDLMPSGMPVGDQWESPDSLGDEITQVADKYSKVTFDHVDIRKRLTTFSMNGPWGMDRNVVYLKVNAKFPNDYPKSCPATFELEKTSAIPQDTLNRISEGLRMISQIYASKGQGCLEVISSYLLGERDLEETTAWLVGDGLNESVDPDPLAREISSDEEEDTVGIGQTPRVQDLGSSGAEVVGTTILNTNVPIPKGCGAVWAKDGRLVCFFRPKDERMKTAIGGLFKDGERANKPNKVFEGFGRLEAGSPETKVTILSSHEDQEPSYDSGEDSFTSSSGSSSSSEEDLMEPQLGGFPRWRQSRARDPRIAMALSADNSQLSVGPGSSTFRVIPSKSKNIVSIYRLDEFLPAKKVLAEEYIIFGEGPSVCQHNARVAERHGFRELVDFWNLSELILYNQVPLEVIEQMNHHDSILVIARQATGRMIKRRDSGLDLAFDEAKMRSIASVTGRTRWGKHPVGGKWLVDAMFRHFEQLADVQMLAILSCIFAEPVMKKATPYAIMDMSLRDRTLPMKVPAFSLDYFPSIEVAWSLYQPTISVPPTPRISHTPVTTYGSAGSAEGQWGREAVAPYSTGTTPPSSYRNGRIPLERGDSQTQSYSTSPEHAHGRRSNASLTSVFTASLSRGMSNTSRSSEPPSAGKKRTSPVHSAAGSLAPGGVTWGTNTFFAAPLDEPAIESSAAYSESDEEYDEERLPSLDRTNMRVTLKNQDTFDGEGGANTALLNPAMSIRRRGYRESYANLLAIWRLEIQRLEILKINGLQLSPEIQQDQSLLSTNEEQQIGDDSSLDWKGLHIESTSRVRTHHNANQPLPPKRMNKKKLSCSICNSLIQGLYAPCFQCGHVWHSHCHQIWFHPPEMSTTTTTTTEEDSEPRTCPTGCGCPCTKFAMVTPRFIVEDNNDDDDDGGDYPALRHPPRDRLAPDLGKVEEEYFVRRNWDEWEYLTANNLTGGGSGDERLWSSSSRVGRRAGGLLRGGGGGGGGGGNLSRGLVGIGTGNGNDNNGIGGAFGGGVIVAGRGGFEDEAPPTEPAPRITLAASVRRGGGRKSGRARGGEKETGRGRGRGITTTTQQPHAVVLGENWKVW